MANGLGPIGNLLGKVDANGALLVAFDSSVPVTATRFLGDDGTAALPTFSFSGTGDGDNGMYLSAADTLGFSAGGTLRLSVSGTAVTSTVPGQFTALGVGVTPPSAGEIQASGNLITAASVKWLSAGTLADIADARWRFQNSAGSAGFLLGGGTESVMRVRTRTDGGYATVDALAYQASGVAGVSFSGAITNLTVVNGIVTAAS